MSSKLHPAPPLPSEIQDSIIDELYSELPSLSRCSLVCKQWLVRARHWLLSDRHGVLIASSEIPSDYKRDAERFVELLSSPNSTIAPFIQHVSVNGPDIAHEAFGVADPQEDYDLLNYLIINNLSRLHGVRTISISFITWDCLREETKAVFANFSNLVSILWESTVFNRLSDLLAFSKMSFPSLRSLKIRQLRVKKPEIQDTGVAFETLDTFLHVRFLDVVLDSELLPLVMSPSMYIQLSNLATLCLGGVSVKDLTLVGGFIEAIGSSLQHLVLDIGKKIITPVTEHAFPISLRHNTNLQTLEISTLIIYAGIQRDASWLPAVIASVNSPVLKVVTLWFNTSAQEPVSSFEFEPFEHSLLRRTDLPELARVNIKFVHTSWWEEDSRRALEEGVKTQLPQLCARGLLKVYVKGAPPSKEFDGWWPYVW